MPLTITSDREWIYWKCVLDNTGCGFSFSGIMLYLLCYALQVISSAAVQLSSGGQSSPEAAPLVEELSLHQPKPWQKVIEDRLKTKTRLISKVCV